MSVLCMLSDRVFLDSSQHCTVDNVDHASLPDMSGHRLYAAYVLRLGSQSKQRLHSNCIKVGS